MTTKPRKRTKTTPQIDPKRVRAIVADALQADIVRYARINGPTHAAMQYGVTRADVVAMLRQADK